MTGRDFENFSISLETPKQERERLESSMRRRDWRDYRVAPDHVGPPAYRFGFPGDSIVDIISEEDIV